MASGSQNNPLTYMDGVSVKISENYKPPKRIPVVMSYSQRVALNKFIQEPVLTYDFSKEESIKSKMYEWKKARTAIKEQRKQRLTQLKENAKSAENEVLNDNESSNIKSEESVSDNSKSTVEPYYLTESGILIPKVVQNESNILTPLPIFNSRTTTTVATCDIKNYSNFPINYSEFETDTSSPFDNMELKILNDLEELAQVLKYDSDENITKKENTCPKSEPTSKQDNMNVNLDNHMPSYGLESSNSKNLPLNGYYFNNYSKNLTTQITEGESLRSVSEIMKALQADLDTTNTTVSKISATASSESASKLPKDDEDDLLKNLSTDMQKVAVNVSSMGFPMSRVVRTCQLFEGNEKKVVEHLLALTELLDLGFPEEKVASALLKCENDRDKALDMLIS